MTVPNGPPEPEGDAARTAAGEAVAIDVLANDTDPDGDPLAIVSVGTTALGGRAACPPSGPCRYVPPAFPAGSHGTATDTFTYTVTDPDGAGAAAVVTITIDLGDPPPSAANHPPSAVADMVAALEDSSGPVFAPAANDTDRDGDTPVVLSVAESASGMVTSLGSGSYRFVPAADWSGTEVLAYTLGDGRGGYDSGTVTITVQPVNDAPRFAAEDPVTVGEDSGRTVVAGWATEISAGPSDESGQALAFEVLSNTAPGLFASGPSLDAATGDLAFTVSPDAFGTAQVEVRLLDDGGEAYGGTGASTVAILVIEVRPVNDPPVFTAGGDVAGSEDSGPVVVSGWASQIWVGPGESGQTASFTVVSGSNPGLFASGPAVRPNGSLRYTPAPDAFGTAVLVVVMTDTGGTADGGANASPPVIFTITISPVNDPPMVADDSFVVSEDATSILAVLVNDSDVEGLDPATLAVASAPGAGTAAADGGTVSYTPAGDFFGSDSLGYRVCDGDGACDTAWATVLVVPTDDPPVAGPDGPYAAVEDTALTLDSADWLGNDANPDGDPLAISVDRTSAWGGRVDDNGDGTVTYVPSGDATGADSFLYTIDDGHGGTSSADVLLLLTAVNDPPSFVPGPDVGVGADSGGYSEAWASSISAGPADEAGQAAGFEIASNDNPGLFASAPTVSPVGVLSFVPAPAAAGVARIAVRLVDDGGTALGGSDASAVFEFRIVVANRPPVARDDGPFAGGEDQPLALNAGDLLGNDEDPDGRPLTIVSLASASAAGGMITDGGSGTLTYTPPADWSGTDWFQYAVGDGLATATGTVIVEVSPVNDPPVAADHPGTGADPGAFEAVVIGQVFVAAFDLLGNDTDADGDGLAVVSSGLEDTALGRVSCDPSGCTYTAGAAGVDAFTYTVADGTLTDSATVIITVSEYLSSPVPLVVNEVYYQGSLAGEEAVEIYNPSSLAVDLAGLRLTDGNVIVGDIDPLGSSASPLDFTFPAADALGATSLLPPGGYAVVWTGFCGGSNWASGASLQYEVGSTGIYYLGDLGDDVWFLDGRQRIIDYLAWMQGTGHEVNEPPPASWWDPTYQDEIIALAGVSISLTPDGTDTGTSACWEVSDSGDAGSRLACVGAPATVDMDSVPGRTTSLGQSNTVSANQRPAAADDGPFLHLEDGERVFAAADWLANDTDGDGDWLTVAAAGPVSAAGGAVADNGDGTFTYDPPADFTGADSFTYTAADGRHGFATATVTVEVTGVNDPPTFIVGPAVTVAEDSGPYSGAWATSIAMGPADEVAQTANFEVVAVSAPELFAGGARSRPGRGSDLHAGGGGLRYHPGGGAPGGRRGRRRRGP